MGLSPKRKTVLRNSVRNAWQENSAWLDEYGFSDAIAELVLDDCDDVRLCWCCGRTGYQETAHIVPHSLEGDESTRNFFLLCAECHLLSPDCSDPKYFVSYVNANAGRAEEALRLAWRNFADRMEPFLDQDPNKAALMESCLESAHLAAKRQVTSHGAFISLSTKIAYMEMVSDKMIEDFLRKMALTN
ncbi:HNH endonuclease signature motif containing protein [Pseudomonas glycinae]|uniref:HNH endonuclease signature motif containing protein n=1 Tax=Pseudomonas glycinae TaxID=1785145 RepID=UPI002B1E3E86|nr:HNH endonuclease [Pseudomonas glycinae]